MASIALLDEDTTIRYLARETNYDAGVAPGYTHNTGWETKESQTQILYRCDFSAEVTGGHGIDAATLYLYVETVSWAGPELEASDYTWKCDRIRRNGQGGATEWIEDEATNLIYATGSNWGTEAAENLTTDRDVTDQALALGPANAAVPCWWSFTVTDLVQDARDNYNDVFDVIIDPGFVVLEDEALYLRITRRETEGFEPYLSITHSGAAVTFVPQVMIF